MRVSHNGTDILDALKVWIGKSVAITLRSTTTAILKGTLTSADEMGVNLTMDEGMTFIPLTSILHITLRK